MATPLRKVLFFVLLLGVLGLITNSLTGCGSSFGILTAPKLELTASVPSGRVAEAYSGKFTITGGTPPYTFTDYYGFPAGLTFNPATGEITGTPLVARNDIQIVVTVTDSGSRPQTASQSALLIIKALGVAITTESLQNGTLNQAYSQQLAAQYGVPPYSWSVTSGVLPDGLRLSQSTGLISGTPTAAQTKTFTVTVTDGDSPVSKSSKEFSIQIQ